MTGVQPSDFLRPYLDGLPAAARILDDGGWFQHMLKLSAPFMTPPAAP